jgi:signal transduction histidine kinase
MRRGSLNVRTISDLRADLLQLAFGDHACPVYQSDPEQLDVTVAFIQIGLNRNERCVFAGPGELLPRVRNALANAGVDVEAETARGALVLHADRDIYLRNGKFDADEMLAYVASVEAGAIADGFSGLRAVGEMSWALTGCTEQELVDYEVRLNRFIKGRRTLVLCQFDRRRFPASFIHDIIRTHPLVLIGREILANPYYQPPDIAAPTHDELDEARIEWWINALRSAQETEQRAKDMAARMYALAEIAGGVVVAGSLEELRKILVDACKRVISFDALIMGLYDESDHSIEFIGAWDQGVYSTPAKVPAADTPAERVLKERRTLVTHRATDPEAQGAWLTGTRRRSESVIRAPMLSGNNAIGILTVHSYTPNQYTDEDARVVEAVAALATAAVERIRSSAEQQAEEERRRGVEEQLRQSQKLEAIGRLAGGVAHDFNNLLVAIGGYAQLALDELGDHPARADIEEVLQNVERATTLTRQLLIFSRKQTHHPRDIQLKETIHNIEKLLRRLIGADVTLKVHTDGECVVHADPGGMEQVIVNLVVNARDAMPEGGEIEIACDHVQLSDGDGGHPHAPRGNYVRLSITDTGHGMEPAVRERIFEPFFTTKAPAQGTGLGLPMVYGIVKQSGGYIDVHSEPGKGARFEILLPCITEHC